MRSERRSDGSSSQKSQSSRLELRLSLTNPEVVGGLNGSRATVAAVDIGACDMPVGSDTQNFDFDVDSLGQRLDERR